MSLLKLNTKCSIRCSYTRISVQKIYKISRAQLLLYPFYLKLKCLQKIFLKMTKNTNYQYRKMGKYILQLDRTYKTKDIQINRNSIYN